MRGHVRTGPPEANPCRRHRRRHHRLLRRVSPGSHGLEGRGPARARPPHVGDDLARRRPDGHVRVDVRDLDRDAQVHARPLRAPRGRDRAVERVLARRVHRGRRRPRPPRGVPAGVGLQSLLRRRRARDLAVRDQGALSAREDRRSARGLLREGGRSREPGRRDDGDGEGGAHAGRGDLRGGRRHRAAPQARRRHRRQDRARRHRGRVRRQLRGHVGAPARREGGREHPAPVGRALLPHHRQDPGDLRHVARPRGPRVARLLPRGGGAG